MTEPDDFEHGHADGVPAMPLSQRIQTCTGRLGDVVDAGCAQLTRPVRARKLPARAVALLAGSAWARAAQAARTVDRTRERARSYDRDVWS